MTEGHKHSLFKFREGYLAAVSVGFFLILAGVLFLSTPNLLDNATSYFKDFNNNTRIPNTDIYVPAPNNPPTNLQANQAVYSFVEQFSMIWGAFLVVMLLARFAIHSPICKRAENSSDIVFWAGAAYLIQTMLIERAEWFGFWATIIMLLGVALIVRGIFLAVSRALR